MRIVGGKHRGRRLEAPKGRLLRPTAERAREAVFDVLAHAAWRKGEAVAGAQVLDVFAGTGALGLEALSRGAAHVAFIEADAAACRLIERNLETLGAQEQATVMRRDASRPGAPPAAATLAFLDPPYRSGLAAPALEALAAGGWLAAGAVVVLELARREPFTPPEGFDPLDERVWGDTQVIFLRSPAA